MRKASSLALSVMVTQNNFGIQAGKLDLFFSVSMLVSEGGPRDPEVSMTVLGVLLTW